MGVETVAIASYLAVANTAAFVAYGVDKSRAQRGAWRISERALIALALVGGALGAFLGMRVFHHKTRKPLFRIVVPLLLVIDVLVFGSALYLSDYYRADAAALTALKQDDGLEVRELDRGIAFVPQDPVAGLVFYPGGKVQAESYAPLLARCARQGVLCVLVKPPFNLSFFDVDAASRAIEEFPEVQKWIVAGHSLGGVAAGTFASEHTESVDAIALLASYSTADLSGSDIRTLLTVGSNDEVLNWDAYEQARSNLPADATELVVEGGNHAYFGDYGAQAGDGEADISRESQQEQTAEAIAGLVASLL